MLKLIAALVLVVLVGVLIVNRERIYVRDPLATVYRNDVEQSGAEVYQNLSDSMLLQEDRGDGGITRTILQDWNEVPGTPVRLICIRWLACLTSDDQVVTLPIVWTGKGKYDPKVTMTRQQVSYVDGDGTRVRVQLR